MYEVNYPISPLIEKGTMTVNIRMMSQIFKQDLSVGIEVLVNRFKIVDESN